jgi:hypothetical protein
MQLMRMAFGGGEWGVLGGQRLFEFFESGRVFGREKLEGAVLMAG